MLVEENHFSQIFRIQSDRSQALASQHFLLLSTVDITVEKFNRKDQVHRLHLRTLDDPETANRFSTAVCSDIQAVQHNDLELDHFNQHLQSAFQKASSNILTSSKARPKHPWISDATLSFIEKRNRERARGDWRQEKQLTRIIKNSVKKDREQWLQSLAGSGRWADIRRIRKPDQAAQGRLKDLQGNLVYSDSRAETMAEYLERIQ